MVRDPKGDLVIEILIIDMIIELMLKVKEFKLEILTSLVVQEQQETMVQVLKLI